MFIKLYQKENKRGMSLVETVVVVALFSLLMVAVMEGVAAFYRFNAYTVAQSYQITNARRGIGSMVRDMREMTYADDGSFPLATVSDNSIAFYSDIDRDNSVEYVAYDLSGTVLTKNIYNATGTPISYPANPDQTYIISEYVQNLGQGVKTFTYYDNNGNEAGATTTVTDIAYIDVQLVINIDPIRDPGEFMLRSSAALRNLKNN